MSLHSKSFKSEKLQKRRRKIIISRIIFFIVLILSFWGFLFTVSALPVINISEITVFGAETLAPSNLTLLAEKALFGRYFFTIPRSNIFFYPKARIRDILLETFPRLSRASVHFNNFHAIKISVSERSPVAQFCRLSTETIKTGNTESCFFLDGNGFAFSAALASASTTETLIKFYGIFSEENPIGKTFGSTGELSRFLNFSESLRSLDLPPLAFNRRPDGAFEATVSGGMRLIFDEEDNFQSVLSNLQSIITDPDLRRTSPLSSIDYIDLRFGNKIFYRKK